MMFKVSVEDVLDQAYKKLETKMRKGEEQRLKEIIEMCNTARSEICVYCSVDETDFKLLYMEDS